MSPIVQFVVEFVSIPAFVKTVGWMFAVAMLLGGVVIRRQKNFMMWTGVTIVFLVFQEWLRFIYFANTPEAGVYTGRPIVFTFLAGLIFFLGIISGIGIVYLSQRPFKKEQTEIITELKETGRDDILEIVIDEKPTRNGNNAVNGGQLNNHI